MNYLSSFALFFVSFFIVPLNYAAEPAAPKTYTNPVLSGEDLADPTVLLYKGTYYLYPTGGTRQGYVVYTSTDLVHWTKGPKVFDIKSRNTWAPDVFFNPADGKFYLSYTANFKIGVAVADSPLGPFVDKGVLVNGCIDAHLFRDDDGQIFLYYTLVPGFRMHVQPMETPLKKKGDPLFLFKPQQPWETKAGAVNEGPWMLKHAGKYYLLYSGSGADWPDYAIGYAVADSPTGPFKKSEGNPIQHRAPGLFGPGHGCVVTDAAGKLWSVYHQKVDDGHNFNRFICIDPLWFDEKGNLHGKATRATPEPAPAPQK